MTEDIKTDTMQVENITLRLRPLDPKARGFFPRYRRIMSARRALTDFAKALPEDIDETLNLLAEHIVEPENHAEKLRVLEMLNQDEVTQIFDLVLGAKTVPPVKDAA